MGYRSEVTSCIYGDPEVMIGFLTKHKLLGSTVFPHFEDDLKVDTGTGCDGTKFKILLLELSDVKWYETYADIKAWNDLLKDAGEVDGLEWEIAIVGEDGATEERRSNGADYIISVNHSIEINY